MGSDLMYRLYHAEHGYQLGGASSFDNLGLLFVSLFFDDGIIPEQVRVERV